jgi:hypothetical protein
MLQERGNPESGFLFVSQTKGKGEQLEVRSINDAIKALAQKSLDKTKAKEFKTKTLRSFYNSALLHAGVSPQELKDLMMGHGRKGARGHYDYDDMTIKEAYGRVFEHLSINGLQVRADIKKLMDSIKGLSETSVIFQRQLDDKDREIGGKLRVKDSEIEQIKQELASQRKSLSSILSLVYDNAGDLESKENESQGERFLELWKILQELQNKNIAESWAGEGEHVPAVDVVEALTVELKRLMKPYEESEKRKQEKK